MNSQIVTPVIIGGDLGAYNMGRNYFEAYHLQSICIAPRPITAIRLSNFFTITHIERLLDEQLLLTTLHKIARKHPHDKLILIGNSDWHALFIAKNRDELCDEYEIPYADYEIMKRATSKVEFAHICKKANISHPHTQNLNIAQLRHEPHSFALDISYPVVIKPNNFSEYNLAHFAGKKKLYTAKDKHQFDAVMRTLTKSSYDGDVVIQELIPGDDTQMRYLTCYIDASVHLSFAGSAQVLLEDHTPQKAGNPVSMIARPEPEIIERARQLLNSLNWRGFANFDVKVDPRDGSYHFLELNPRPGRNVYVTTAGGANPAFATIRDLVFADYTNQTDTVHEEYLYSLVPFRLLKRYITDDAILEDVTNLHNSGKFLDPFLTSDKSNLRRWATVHLQRLNQYRKFHTYYPRVTSSGM
ncbi:hypothetical protein ACFQY8_06895 [Alloscardovia venturai]|uniref:ATP-grasp domain-containing protein n=1 Tax=Alloscardovia venturai TaxID=1769421 RepID=A0ABW2YBG6_9BIFI